MAPKGRRIRVPRGPAPDVQRPNITSGVRGLQHLSAGTRDAVGAGSVAWIRRGVATREVSRGFAASHDRDRGERRGSEEAPSRGGSVDQEQPGLMQRSASSAMAATKRGLAGPAVYTVGGVGRDG